MNTVFSTKDRANLIIEEEMMSKVFSALIFSYDGDTGCMEVKIARDNEEGIVFTLDSLKAMKSIACFMYDKAKEAEELAESGNNQTRVMLNDEAVQSLWIKMSQEGKDIRS